MGWRCLRFAVVLPCAEYTTLMLGSGEGSYELTFLISVGQDFGQLAWVILVFISHT